MPVSVTSKRTRAPSHAHAHGDLAGLGELDGVGEQVGEHLAQPAAVAVDHRRDVVVDPGHQLEALAVRLRREHLAGVFDGSRRSKSWSSSSSLPASIFEKSRMSLMTSSSASPELAAVCAYSRCCGVEVGVRAAARSSRSRR